MELDDFNILLSNLLFQTYLLEKYRFIIFYSEFLDQFYLRHQFDINNLISKSFPWVFVEI